MNELDARQKSEHGMRLQLAAAALNIKVQRSEAARIGISSGIALLGVFSVFVSSVAPVTSVVGLIWALVSSSVLQSRLRQRLRDVACAQEMFDTYVYGLSWNSGLVGHPLGPEVITALSRKIRQDGNIYRSIQDGWYTDTAGVSHEHAVQLCQYQNLAWDIRLRRRYLAALLIVAVLWLAIGFVIFLGTASLVVALLSWLIPALPIASNSLELAVRQVYIYREKSVGSRELLQRLSTPPKVISSIQTEVHPRMVQDCIYVLRQESPRVPGILYRWSRDRDEGDFGSLKQSLLLPNPGG